jgi:hypothetical protein
MTVTKGIGDVVLASLESRSKDAAAYAEDGQGWLRFDALTIKPLPSGQWQATLSLIGYGPVWEETIEQPGPGCVFCLSGIDGRMKFTVSA